MKTLIVQFTPRTGSHTARLVEQARRHIRGDIAVVDLAAQPPALLSTVAVDAYVKRNYGGVALSESEQAALAEMDANVQRLLAADVLITAAPMHNFAMPGPLKTFFDGVIQKGYTWDADASGYRGKMGGKRALALFTSGGVYEGPGNWDHYTPLVTTLFQFMGYEGKVISAQGTNRDAAAAMDAASAQLETLLPGWYA